MKVLLLAAALFGAAALFSQEADFFYDSTLVSVNLEQINLVDGKDSIKINGNNTFNSIESLLQQKESINLIVRGNFAQDPLIRSYKAGQINVTLNGMRIYGACTDRMDPVTSYAESSNLKSISLSHGSSASIDNNAFGGSIDLKLKEASFSGISFTSGSFGSSYQTNTNGFHVFGQLKQSHKNWGLLIQASTRNANNYFAGGDEEVEFSQYQKINSSAELLIRLSPKDRVKFNFLYDKAQDVGYPALPMDVGLAEAMIGGVNYLKILNGNVFYSLETLLYYNSIYHEMDDTKRPNVPMHMDMPGWSKTFGGWAKLKSINFNKHQLESKLEYYQNFRRAEMTMYPPNEIEMFMLTWPDIMRRTAGIAIADNWLISEKWSLASSVRLDVNNSFITTEFGKQHFEVFGYDVDDSFIEPIFSIKENFEYKLDLKSKFTLNLAYAERVPDVSEQFGFYLYNANDGYDYIGNPNILKETSYQVELGFKQEFEKLNWHIRGFAHLIDNYILGRTDSTLDPMTIGANGVRVYTNLDFARIYGFEHSFNYFFNDQLTLSNSFQYTLGEENTKEPLPLISPLKGNIKAQWNNKGWLAWIQFQWAAKQSRVNENFGDQTTPSYGLINMSLSKDISFYNIKLKTAVGVSNLLDTNYRDHLSWGQIPQMGRNITINLNFSF